MFDDITIFIPTLGRPNRQPTWYGLPRQLQERTYLLVESQEVDAYRKANPKAKLIMLPDFVEGISEVRQWSLDNCQTQFMFLVDDDMTFFKRIPDTTKLKTCTDGQVWDMFYTLVYWMDQFAYPLVGVSARQGNNYVPQDSRTACRQMNFHGIHVPSFRKYGVKLNALPVMEDFHMILSLLTSGRCNRVSYTYCWNQYGSGAKGGCSNYRTPELQKECAEKLKQQFPQYVTLVEKTSKSGWEGLETRTDVRVQWKKAYNHAYKDVL